MVATSILSHIAVVIIELTPNMTTVPEDVGVVQLCLNVTQPTLKEELVLEIFVDLNTVVGSAGMHSLLIHFEENMYSCRI